MLASPANACETFIYTRWHSITKKTTSRAAGGGHPHSLQTPAATPTGSALHSPSTGRYAFITAYSTLTVAITYKHRVHTEEAHGGQLGCASCPVLLSSKLPGLSTNQAWAHFGGSNNDRSGSARIPIKRSTFLPCSQQRRSRQQQRQQSLTSVVPICTGVAVSAAAAPATAISAGSISPHAGVAATTASSSAQQMKGILSC